MKLSGTCYQVIVTYAIGTTGHQQQTYNCPNLDSMWARVHQEQGKSKVRRIRVYAELACFEIEPSGY